MSRGTDHKPDAAPAYCSENAIQLAWASPRKAVSDVAVVAPMVWVCLVFQLCSAY
jgi:hypothetical protein